MGYKEFGSWETRKTAYGAKKTLKSKGYKTKITKRKSVSLSGKPFEYTLFGKK